MDRPPTYSSREDQAKAEVGVTAISRARAFAAVSIFLTTIFGVFLVDQLAGAVRDWRLLARVRDLRYSLHAFESAVEDDSAAARATRPFVTTALTGVGGAAAEQVDRGRDGWLFYDPDVRHVTMPGFLEARAADPNDAARRRRQLDVVRDRNPIHAILDLQRQLATRNITLLIVPTPVKPTVHPEMLWPGTTGPVRNASFARFKAELEARGVLVFDVADALVADARTGRAQYLATDTHWRPEAMDRAAANLANFVTDRVRLPQSLGIEYRRSERPIDGRGDLAAMLASPHQPRTESVTLHPVLQPDGRPWSPRADAEILWLGDSFSNIYSADAMNWGSTAGFVEQFSYHLGRPVDAIRRNDDGAFATRQMLADDLARGNNRLAGKKLVIWQFATRELSFGNWRPIELTLHARPPRRFVVPPPGQIWTITGTVADRGAVPRPGNVAYRDHVLAIHLRDVAVDSPAGNDTGEAIVYLRSMIDGGLTPAANLQVGQRVRLSIRDWSEVARQYEIIHRSDLPDPQLRSQPACWGELLP
ncbi:MAG TPA: hypothetical protein VH475_26905 [Tepidisphaeraceae bacterium]|jgi:alginate O-acetyltransferase complex protein AlgJ